MLTVVVEGNSDQAALAALAARQGRDLASEGVDLVVLDGITNLPAWLRKVDAGAAGEVRVLVDENEAPYAARHLGDRGRLYVCVADLEDEMVRALGVAGFEAVVDAAGELAALRSMQRQPAQRDRPIEAQLRRFVGTRGGRKIRYGRLLLDAVDLDRVPAPLLDVLTPP